MGPKETVIVMILISALLSCSSDSDSNNERIVGSVTDCTAMYEAVCEKACDCGEDYCLSFGKVSTSYNSDPESCLEGVEEDCAEDVLDDRDFKGCIQELEQAKCTDASDSDGLIGVELPDVCSYAICKRPDMEC